MSDYQYQTLVKHYQSDQKLLYQTLISLYDNHAGYLAKNIIKETINILWEPQPENINEFKKFLIKHLKLHIIYNDYDEVEKVISHDETKKHISFLYKNINELLPIVGDLNFIKIFHKHNIIKTNSKYIDTHLYYLEDNKFELYKNTFDEIIRDIGATRIILNNAELSNNKTKYLLTKINNTDFFKELFINDSYKYLDKDNKKIIFIYKNIIKKLGLPTKLRLLTFSMANDKKELFTEILNDSMVLDNINANIADVISLPAHNKLINKLQPILQMKQILQCYIPFNIMTLSIFVEDPFYHTTINSIKGTLNCPTELVEFINKSKNNIYENFNHYMKNNILQNDTLFHRNNIEQVLVRIEQQQLEQNILNKSNNVIKNRMKI